MQGYFRAVAAGEFAAVDPTLAAIIGRPPTRMRAFLARHLPGSRNRRAFAILVTGLDQSVIDLAALGVEVVSPPKSVPDGSGDRFAFICDNERMLIELFEPAG